MSDLFKRCKKFDVTFLPLAVLIILTLFRLYLGIMTPVYLQADAYMDDFLYVQYACNLLSGKWLGDFSALVLLKTAAPAFLLALSYIFGVSYPVFLTVGYLIAVGFFSLAMYRLTQSRRFAMVLYAFLLYSPGMFHEENVQKVYRGGYIVIFTLLVFAAVIGQYAVRKSGCRREILLWSGLGCVALPIFYYLKEDSVWILPFVYVGTVLTLLELWREKHTRKLWRFAAALSPLLVLVCVTAGYQALNYHYYGVYTVTDRGGTYCKEVLSELLQVDDGKKSDTQIWVTRNMVYTAAEHSEALEALLPYVDQSWNNWFGEGNEAGGDFYIWAFRDAVQLSGAYDKGGAYVNACYREIHEDLQKAFESGALKQWEGRIYISSTARGFTLKELADYYGERFPQAVRILAEYRENVTSSQEGRGLDENLALMSHLTRTHFRRSGTNANYYKGDEWIAAVDRKIVRLYQKTGWAAFGVGLLGIGVMLASSAVQAVQRKISARQRDLLLVTLGLAGSCALLMVAVVWFCNFLPDRKIYDYLCAVIPLMEAVEVIGGYVLVCKIRKFWKKRRGQIQAEGSDSMKGEKEWENE